MTWRPPKRKSAPKGRHAPVDIETERRIENGRRAGLEAKYKRGEREHARATTPEFRIGYDKIDWSA